jgi:cytochrome c peroxidase
MLLARLGLPFAAATALIALGGCRSSPEATEPRTPETTVATAGPYLVTWQPDPAPLPLNAPFELEVRVRHDDGSPWPGLDVQADARMPHHGHGMLRTPLTTDQGDGSYRIRGLLFHMAGHWTLFLYVGEHGSLERLAYQIELEPPPAAGALLEFTPEEVARILTLSPMPPPPDDPTSAFDTSAAAARLGEKLFFERRLSRSGTLACASCHDRERQWCDARPLAEPAGDPPRHTPSLWNVASRRWLFWDGRADSLWAQAIQALENPRELDADRLALARLLRDDAELARAYAEAFGPLPRTLDDEQIERVLVNAAKALAAFERTMVSGPTPFDTFVAGLRDGDPAKLAALSPGARRGLALFVGRGGCVLCHSGPHFTDEEFHNDTVPPRADLPFDPGRQRGIEIVRSDPHNGGGASSDARDEVARRAAVDKLGFLATGHALGEFRTPSLRNVARTAPYMHQGQVATLDDVIEFYSTFSGAAPSIGHVERLLKPLRLTPEEKTDLKAFLESLSG